jgi:hypothetical protein
VVSPADKLDTNDFERLRLLTDPHIEKHGDLNGLLIDAESLYSQRTASRPLIPIRFQIQHPQRRQGKTQ